MSRVFIGLGSNEGDRLTCISRAVKALSALSGTRLVQMAMISETEPAGGPPQDPYLNTAVEIETALGPLELLKSLKEIERRFFAIQDRREEADSYIEMPAKAYV